jgi:glucose-1-phosphate thymidylyltransferase
MIRKGIVLAGGAGTRLHPVTRVISKQLLPVYDKPMIHYPLATLMLAGIRKILVITTPSDATAFRHLLGDGSQLGIDLTYSVQAKPEGLAQAFTIGRDFVGRDGVAMVLGDNLFYGGGFATLIQNAARRKGATIFGYWVKDPGRYGVVELDARGRPVSIAEKPKQPKSNWAITGLYFFDNHVLDVAARAKKSARGEYEITGLIDWYRREGDLHVEPLSRGIAWLDTGTHDSLLEAAEYVRTIESRQGLKIACLEEVAFRMGFIDVRRLRALAAAYRESPYRDYLSALADEARTPTRRARLPSISST